VILDDEEPAVKKARLEAEESKGSVSIDGAPSAPDSDALSISVGGNAVETSRGPLPVELNGEAESRAEGETLESAFGSPSKSLGAPKSIAKEVGTEGETIVERSFIEDANGILTEIIVRHDPLPKQKKE